MRNSLLTAVALVLLGVGAVGAETWNLGTASDPASVVVEQSNNQRIVVRFDVGSFAYEPVDINGDAYNLISCGDEGIMLNAAEPALPRFCRSVIVPDDAHMIVKVVDAEYVDIPNLLVAPSKGNLLRSVNPDDVPYTFGDVYARDAFYPDQVALLREPYILRDYRGQVIELNAFRYNPVQKVLRVYTSVTVELVPEGPGTINVLRGSKRDLVMVQDFDLLYRRHFINYGFEASKYTPIPEFGDLLIIANDAWMDEMQPFVDWKMQKGMKVTMIGISQIGNNSAAIDAFIQSFYDSTELAYVLLVGDNAHVTRPSGSGYSDPVYGKVAGTDNYPDIFMGRFSAESPADVITQVERSVTYELNPAPGDWLHKGMCIASDDSGTGQGGEHDWEHEGLIRNDLLNFTYTWVDTLWEMWGLTSTQVANAWNDGRSIINYTGHGSYSSWSSSGFSVSHVNALINDNKLPFIINVACNNGQFDTYTCFCESHLRATNNITGAPTGAIGSYGSLISQSWSPPMDCQDEVVDLLCAKEKVTYGGLCYNGACKMIDINGSSGVSECNAWTLFGDPSIVVRTDTPAELSPVHDPVALFTATYFDVTVAFADPAQCALYSNGVLYGSAFTDETGFAHIVLDETLPVGESVTLTITAFNAATYTAEITVITPSGPYVIYDEHVLDDASGNGDGLADAGESIVMDLGLTNVGPDDAYGVEGTITTDDEYVTITDGTESFGMIPGDFGAGYAADGYAFEIAGDCPDGHKVLFDLSVTGTARETWYGSFQVPVHAPVLSVLSIYVNDASGDNNGILDPGETAELTVTLKNAGSGTAVSLTGTLSETDEYVSVLDSYGDFGTLSSSGGTGDNSGDVYEVSADEDCPLGYGVPMGLSLTTSSGQSFELAFNVTVGDRVAFYVDDFSYDQGWTGLGGVAQWQIGSCQGLGGDPSSDHSATSDNFVLGNDLNADGKYANSISSTQWVYSPPIDCAHMSGVILTYYRWLGIESASYDHAYLEVYDGASWVNLFTHTGATVQATAWSEHTYDLSAVADSNPNFQIRFGFGTTDGSGQYSGWNIDDITLMGYGRIGYPSMELSSEPIVAEIQPGLTYSSTVKVKNTGEGTLRVWFTSLEPWIEHSGEQLVVVPGDSADYEVTLNGAGLGCGDFAGTLSYTSNDNSHPSGDIGVSLRILSPDVFVDQTPIVQELGPEETSLYPLTIENNGPGRLDYTVFCQMDMPRGKSGGGLAASDVTLEVLGYNPVSDKGDAPEAYYAGSGKGTGGPDVFGYSWIDSDEASGPEMNWVDISGVGTSVTLGDDASTEAIPLGFSFPLYDSVYTEVYICSNGLLSFDEAMTSRNNVLLPSGDYHSLLAMYWDDLDPRRGGNIYYYYDAAGGRFIVSFVGIKFYSGSTGTGSLTFQAILTPEGGITLQYQTMDAGILTLTGGTVGLQNAAGDDGLTVVYNAEYMHNGLAVAFVAQHWLSSLTLGGSIAPYSSTSIDLKFDASEMDDGVYTGTVLISTNDPATPSLPVSVELTVSSGPQYICGDIDNNQTGPDISDLLYLVNYMFKEGPAPAIDAAADVNGDDGLDIDDIVYLVNFMFKEGPALICN